MQKIRNIQNSFALWEKDEKPLEVTIDKIPKLKELIGSKTDLIKTHSEMDNTAQKFPVVDDDLCVNCGKCYLTCLDSGYQAIKFNSKTHKPEITTDCTGCLPCSRSSFILR